MNLAFKRGQFLVEVTVYIVFTIIIALYLYPILRLILTSFGANYSSVPPEFIPKNATIEGYETFLTNPTMVNWIINSLIFTFGVTFGNMGLGILAGYALSRINFIGRGILFWLILAGMMMPGVMLYVPLFVMLTKLRLINTYMGLLLPPMAGAFNIFLVKQAFDAIPKDFEEAAIIDGAGTLTIAFKVLLPLIRPIIITAMLYNIVWNWNNFAWPWFVAPDRKFWTLPLGVYLTSWSYTVKFWEYAAGAVITFLLPLVLFIVANVYFIRGIRIAGLKR
ncbi:MAG: carbohydrate ABC transporter permease [Ignisphaera sp.]